MLWAGPVVFLIVGLGGLALGEAFLAYPVAYAKALILAIEFAMLLTIAVTLGLLVAGTAGTGARRMSTVIVFGLCAAMAAGLGLYGVIVHPQPLRKILAFNLLGSGVFLFFGVVARRGAAAGFGGDPIPQALVITGMVVAFAATALALALLLRLFQATGSATLRPDGTDK